MAVKLCTFSGEVATCIPALSAADALVRVGPRQGAHVLSQGNPCPAFQCPGILKVLVRDRTGPDTPLDIARHDNVQAQAGKHRVSWPDVRRFAMRAALHGETSAPICLDYSIIFGNRITRELPLSASLCRVPLNGGAETLHE